MTTAIYAISADPITNGHMDIINRARKHFDTLIVGIGNNEAKTYTLPKNQRVRLAADSTSDMPNVHIVPFSGLLVDFAIRSGASCVIRAARSGADYEYEQQLHHINTTQNSDIEVFLMVADPTKAHISSSSVKSVLKSGGDITSFVPAIVNKELRVAMKMPQVVGVTGSIASGKSTLCDKLVETFPDDFVNIDLDIITHSIFEAGSDLTFQEKTVLTDIITRFPKVNSGTSGNLLRIDRSTLSQYVFGPENVENKEWLTSKMANITIHRINDIVRSCKPSTVVLLNTALLVDCGMLSMCSNRVIFLNTPPSVQISRMIETRNMTELQAQSRLNAQLSNDEKLDIIRFEIELSGRGMVFPIDTTKFSPDDPEDIQDVASLIKLIAEEE